MRSSAGEKAGQLPVPRSVTLNRPSTSSIDSSRDTTHWFPGVAS